MRIGCTLVAVLISGALSIVAQQDDGPILLPKKPIVKQDSSTLLVLCDLTCNWSLDGEMKGGIKAGDSAKMKVELGQHIVSAVTEDGIDQVKQFSEVKSNGQTIVSIELKPIRDARLEAEQLARDNAEQEARIKAAQEEAAKTTWTDLATRLMWTKVDSSIRKGVGDSTGLLTWDEAVGYCRNLQLEDYKDWRLPTIDELEGIYDPKLLDTGFDKPAIKGNLRISIDHWSTTPSKYKGMVLTFNFFNGMRGDKYGNSIYETAYTLCVRHSKE
jgi:hypothetical protein